MRDAWGPTIAIEAHERQIQEQAGGKQQWPCVHLLPLAWAECERAAADLSSDTCTGPGALTATAKWTI